MLLNRRILSTQTEVIDQRNWICPNTPKMKLPRGVSWKFFLGIEKNFEEINHEGLILPTAVKSQGPFFSSS